MNQTRSTIQNLNVFVIRAPTVFENKNCQLIRSSLVIFQFLVWHIGWEHVRIDIEKKFQVSNLNHHCPLCGQTVKQYMHLIIHLAQMHLGLKGLVDEAVFEFLNRHKAFRRVSLFTCGFKTGAAAT